MPSVKVQAQKITVRMAERTLEVALDVFCHATGKTMLEAHLWALGYIKKAFEEATPEELETVGIDLSKAPVPIRKARTG